MASGEVAARWFRRQRRGTVGAQIQNGEEEVEDGESGRRATRRRGGGALGGVGTTMAGRTRVLELDPEGDRGKWGVVRGEWAVG